MNTSDSPSCGNIDWPQSLTYTGNLNMASTHACQVHGVITCPSLAGVLRRGAWHHRGAVQPAHRAARLDGILLCRQVCSDPCLTLAREHLRRLLCRGRVKCLHAIECIERSEVCSETRLCSSLMSFSCFMCSLFSMGVHHLQAVQRVGRAARDPHGRQAKAAITRGGCCPEAEGNSRP